MRRKELEVTDLEKIKEILESCKVMRIGFYAEGNMQIFPVNFGYELNNGALTLFFHGAQSGAKAEMSAKNPLVAFEMDEYKGIKGEGFEACQYTTYYKSIMGNGKLSLLEAAEDKEHALDRLMQKAAGKGVFEYSQKVIEKTNVYKIDVQNFSAKAK